jgi:PPK2 family polyphosphate:nucleotide phosphotransferase
MKKIRSNDFRVAPATKVKLKDWPTLSDAFYTDKENYLTLLDAQIEALRERQTLLYADNRQSLLIVLQAMDAAGKDSAIKHVMTGLNPQGCQVLSFKHPSATELDHDFLWRTTRELPERGHIGIFNRSYYEEVLIVRVHKEILAAQNLPDDVLKQKDFWQRRYQSINDFEKHLTNNGTRVLKFFLHVSADEQKKRFLERIDNPEKNWKITASDIEERAYWQDYMKAYEACISATSTEEAPWYIVPADDKQNSRLIFADTVLRCLEEMDLRYPKLDDARREALQSMREQLLR